jgi:hypothetical protein
VSPAQPVSARNHPTRTTIRRISPSIELDGAPA